MPQIQYKGPDGRPVRFPLARRLTTIGSSAECDIQLSGIEVADSHATVTHEPGRYVLESTRRANVFFVNGRKLRSHELSHGEVVVIGGTELAFSTVDAPPPAVAEEELGSLQVAAMQRLQTFSELLQTKADLDAMLDELIDQVVALTGASKGFLVLGNELGKYVIRVARNLERQPVDDPEQLLSDKIIREVIDQREGQIISDAYNDQRFQNSLSVINLRLCSVMCVPMIVRGELIGLIYVGNDDVVGLFRAEQLELLKVFAAQAALFIKSAREFDALETQRKGLAEKLEKVRFGSIIGACPLMIEVFKKVEKVAGTDITVLVTGETGTGKELIAHEIHDRSQRRTGPFITVNCGAIPENLIESELFGHTKGAFTGAVANQMGKFQAADKGTIFLDEIGELPLPMQVKLLRVLQEREVQRVGENKTTPVDIRVVAATNRDLLADVKNGKFREDLYFRLNVINIELPPLRDRGDDVLLIARYFAGRYATEYGRDIDPQDAFAESAERAIMNFSWPGNIRQLENHIKKALVLADGPKIAASDLDLDTPAEVEVGEESIIPLTEARDRWQRSYINRVLALNDGNRTKTARDLGVDPRTIFRHLEKEKAEEASAD